MYLSRVPGKENLYVGGLMCLRKPDALLENNVTHILSVLKYSLEVRWSGSACSQFRHMSIDVDDLEEVDLLQYFSKAVRYIESGLYPPKDAQPTGGQNQVGSDGTVSTEVGHAELPLPPVNPGLPVSSPGAVYVHCAMGKSRSVSCVVAYLLWKHPHRFGGKQVEPDSSTATWAAQRRATAKEAVSKAIEWVRRGRQMAEPNPGFHRQLEMWWTMGCPADEDEAVEKHPIYQKWLYECRLEEARSNYVAPELEWIRFEDEAPEEAEEEPTPSPEPEKRVRCKKCRRILATSRFIVEHQGLGNQEKATCPHVFIDTLSWMRPTLETGALDGRLLCPNDRCGATIGRFAWQGLKCSCNEWVCPAFSLNRGRVDEMSGKGLPGARQENGSST